MYMDNSSPLEELLGTSIAEFDIPDAVYLRAIARYQGLADWLSASDRRDVTGSIYTQGSIRLGTVVAPIDPSDDYDLDLVYRRDVEKEAITKEELKETAGLAIAGYLETGPEGEPRLSEGKRCWTLEYPHEPFHMDILPSIPNRHASPNGILLTDRELRAWQPSNPVDFAEWFSLRMQAETKILREALAKRMDVEQAPPSELKTTLQRTVQALKRHRDLYFSGSSEEGPASIIITTLAGLAYSGAGSLYEVLTDVTARMPHLVERRGGVYWVPNPVQPDENFADRWAGEPGRAENFFRWIESASTDFRGLGEDSGLDQIIEKMATSFGDSARRAAKRYGSHLREKREAGALAVGATGVLGQSGVPIRRHTFHGDAPEQGRG
jgi:hypothetical protein